MISRYLVIVLAFGVAAYRLSHGAWIEATGLGALGAGLILLRMAATRPQLRRTAWLAFLVTAVALGTVLVRDYT
jgi:hypothetical protein